MPLTVQKNNNVNNKGNKPNKSNKPNVEQANVQQNKPYNIKPINTRSGNTKLFSRSNNKDMVNTNVEEEEAKAEVSVMEELEDLRKAVLFDSLTGVYSMRNFSKKGTEMLNKEGSVTGIIVFAVNNLDRISVMFGMEECDKVRKHIGQTMQRILTNTYLYGRVHEDLFAVMTHYDEEDELVNVVELLCEHIVEYGNNAKLELSFGIYRLEQGKDTIEEGVSKAELAKRTVRSVNVGENFAFFTEEIEKRMEEDKKMGEEMDHALAHRQFVMYLQPIVNIRTHEIVGSECLVRWKHPTMGVLSPFKFIPLFEANNFIIKMDHYVWNEAFRAIRHWIDNKVEPIPININISPIHFEHQKFVETLCGLAKKHKVPESYICLEMPEKIFSEPSEKIDKVLSALREAGFSICIDNFGSYHSPISFFMNSPVTVIKVDRNFLRDNMQSEKGEMFMRYLYAMAAEFDMQIIAEGVEDMEQVIELTDMGCEYAQGFFFGKPMDLREFDLMRKNNMKNKYIPKVLYPTFEFEDEHLLP